jgi:hypothetical protein
VITADSEEETSRTTAPSTTQTINHPNPTDSPHRHHPHHQHHLFLPTTSLLVCIIIHGIKMIFIKEVDTLGNSLHHRNNHG